MDFVNFMGYTTNYTWTFVDCLTTYINLNALCEQLGHIYQLPKDLMDFLGKQIH